MLGLLRKDYLLIKKNISAVYLFVFVAILLPIVQNRSLMIPIISLTISLLFAMQVLQTISFDESTNWKKFILAMPLSATEITLSKYVLSLILAVLSSIMVTLIGGLLIVAFRGESSTLLFYVILSFVVGIVYNSFIIPISIKFGSHNCKYIMMFFVTLPTLIAFVLNYFNIDFQNVKIDYNLFLLALIIISLIISAISYYISLQISDS